MLDKLSALVAAFNEGANKGFWRFQWRDRYGKWVEMGRGILGKLRLKDGSIVNVRGVFVGGTENPGYGRVLVEGQGAKGIPDGIYHFASGNGEEFDALIPEEALERIGIDPNKKDIFGNSVGERLDKDIQDFDTIVREDITPEDRKLATDVPDDNQKKIIDEERSKSPIAKLPPGTESRDPDAIKKILEDNPFITTTVPVEKKEEETPLQLEDYRKMSGEELDDIVYRSDWIVNNKIDKAARERIEKASEEGKRRAKLRNKTYDEGVGRRKSDATEPTEDLEKALDAGLEFREIDDNGNDVVGKVFKNGYQTSISKNEDGSWKASWRDEFGRNEGEENFDSIDEAIKKLNEDIFNREFEIPEDRKNDPRLKAIKEAFDKAKAGETPDIDDVIQTAKSGGSDKGDDGFDDIDWFDEGEPAVPDKKGKKEKPKPEITEEPEAKEKPAKGSKKAGEGEIKKVKPEDLDKLGKPEDYIEDFGGFQPSLEQTRVLNALVVGDYSTVVDALAGSGKTTTFIGAANLMGRLRPDARILITTFNKINASDAKARCPKFNTDARTSHSLAFGIMYGKGRGFPIPGSQLDAFTSRKKAIVSKDDDLALFLGCDDTPVGGEKLDAGDSANLVKKSIIKFCNSADKEITKAHILEAFKDRFGDDLPKDFEVPDKFLDWANAFWKDVTTPYVENIGKIDPSTKKFVGKQRIKITDDHYFKMWCLSNPDLREIKINGKPLTHLWVDEAQDTNPAFAAVLDFNKDKVKISFVGDTNQNIYGFRGTENVLESMKQFTEAALDLTQTRRFGDGMTAPGNAALNIKGASRRVKGTGSGGQIMDWEDMPDGGEHGTEKALIVRSNYGGIKEIMAAQAEGKTVSALSVFHNEIENAIYHMKWLVSDYNTRGPKPTKPVKTLNPDTGQVETIEVEIDSKDFAGITNMKEWNTAKRRDPNGLPARMLDFYRTLDEEIKPFTDMLDKLVVDRSDVADSTVLGAPDVSEGAEGVLWSAPSGPLVYTIDERGLIRLSGSAFFQKLPVNPLNRAEKNVAFKEVLKQLDLGFSWDPNSKTWNIRGASFQDEDERKEILLKVMSIIPKPVDDEKENKKPDFVVTTAHRAKGLEWDYVGIGTDWKATNPRKKKVKDPETGMETETLVWPTDDELNLAYVALTRGRKGINYGIRESSEDDPTLEWLSGYEGREGLRKINVERGRDPEFGMDAWDYHEKQSAEQNAPKPTKKKPTDPDDIQKALGCTGFNGEVHFYDEDDADMLPETSSEAPGAPPKNPPAFLSTWISNSDTDRDRWSKSVDGFRWELTRNKDGSVTLRPRTDSSIGTKKYPSLKEAIKDFPNMVEAGKKSNREALKKAVAPFDKDGKIANAIDSGKTASEINDLITSTDEWEQAVEDKKVNFLTLKSALSRVGNNFTPSRMDRPKTRRPRKVQKLTAQAPSAAPKGSLYDAAPPQYRDDGSALPRAALKPENARDLQPKNPSEVIRALVGAYGGKLRRDGSVLLHRDRHIEQAGPARGQERDVEIAVKEGKDGTFTMMISVTNPKTGETKTYYHYKKYHSLDTIIGDAEQEKSVGVERLLGQYFARDVANNPYPNDDYAMRWGGVDGSIKKLRAGSLKNILADRTSDDSTFKLRTPDEHATIALNGRDRRLNRSLQNWWTQKRAGRDSLFESIENGDKDTTVELYRTYFNGLPDTPDAKKKAISFISAALKQKFPALDQRELKHMIDNIDSQVASELPQIGLPVEAHLAWNGKIVQTNDLVRWKNNVGQAVIGRVVAKMRINNPNEGRKVYNDFALVEFADGSTVELNTKHMEALEQYDVENPKYEMTDYANWVRKGELKADRALEAGFDVDYNNGNVIDKTGAVVDNIYDDNTNAAPELSTLISKEAKKLKVGDVLHDDAGNRLGLVTKVKRAPGKTGVILDNGNRIPFNNNDPINVASTRTVAQQAKVGTVGKKAAKLELGTTPDGKTAKKLAVNPEDASIAENVTPIKGNSKKKALKPTKEATDAKNKVVELGKEVWEKSVEPKIIEILKAKGYDVNSMVDIDQLAAAAKKVADDEAKKYVDAGKKISKYLDDQVKKITPAELSKLEPAMAADKLIKSNGSRDVSALEKRLRDAGFSGLASDIAALPSVSKKEDEVAHSKLFAFGYKMLNSKNAAQIDKLQSLYSDKDKANKSRIEAVRKFNDVDKALGLAEKDATLQAMKDEGVEFDNVSIREFEGRIISYERGLPLEPGNTFLSSRALNEAFENMPRSMILQLVEHLKSTNQTLKIRAGVKRGHFATVPGGYELDLSAIPSPLPGQTKHTSTAGHEIMHFMQEVIPNLRTLEHAWSYDRLLQNKGTADETLPNIMGLPGKKTELTFAAPGMSALYTFKQYSKNKEIFLNPHDKSSEVASTIFEDMFTNPGYVSRSKGNTVVSKEPGKAKKLYKDAVFDEATQTWYTDESLVTPIPNVVGEYGRRKSDGVDKNVKHFGIGLFMALNDWSSTGSTGTTPRKPRKKK